MAQRVSHTWTAQAVLLVGLAFCYMPALTATYGFADDFVQLLESQQSRKWLQHAWNAAARPIGGALTEWSFHEAGTIAGLAYLRAAGLVLLLLLAVAIYRHLLKSLHEPVLAGLGAVFVATTTPFQVSVGWASMWLYLIPPLLSYPAYHAILRSEQGTYRERAKWLLLASLLLYISLNIYPPSTMFLWFWFGTEAVFRDTGAARVLRRFALFLAICGGAFAVYYGIYRAFGYHHARGQVVTEIAPKAAWFLEIVMPRASRLQWYDNAAGWLPVTVWGVILAGILLLRHRSVASLAVKIGVCAAAVALSYLPMLIVKELDGPFRSRTALTGFIGGLVFLAVLQIMVRLRAPAILRYVVLIALVGAGLLKAHATLVSRIVTPQSHDYQYLKEALASGFAAHQRVVIVAGVIAPNCWDELCRVTTDLPLDYPMITDMAMLILWESRHTAVPVMDDRLQVVAHGTQVAGDADTAVIDMGVTSASAASTRYRRGR